VLAAHFPGVPLHSDVRELGELPPVDLVAAGFPCQDLSQAGKTAGIGGAQSGLVGEVFRLLGGMKDGPRWRPSEGRRPRRDRRGVDQELALDSLLTG
jgi:DNA (cytosine-5)-methyltransferase 1